MKAAALFRSIDPLRRPASSLRRRRAEGSLVIGLLVVGFLLACPGESRAQHYITGKTNPAKCLHKQSGGWANGNAIHVWDCDAGPAENKTWTYDANTGYIRGEANPAKCLHKRDGGWANGNPIHVWDCDAGPAENKAWTYDPGTGYLHGAQNPAKCLHKQSGGWANGNPIHVWDCNAGPAENKAWSVGSYGEAQVATVMATAIEDSLTLVALYEATDGPQWTDRQGWLTDPVASWAGVTVEEGRVTHLDLSGNALSGSIPAALGDLGKLNVLKLSDNRLSGWIPAELGDLGNLRELDLSDNRLSGWVHIELRKLHDRLNAWDLTGNPGLCKVEWAYQKWSDLRDCIPKAFSTDDRDDVIEMRIKPMNRANEISYKKSNQVRVCLVVTNHTAGWRKSIVFGDHPRSSSSHRIQVDIREGDSGGTCKTFKAERHTIGFWKPVSDPGGKKVGSGEIDLTHMAGIEVHFRWVKDS